MGTSHPKVGFWEKGSLAGRDLGLGQVCFENDEKEEEEEECILYRVMLCNDFIDLNVSSTFSGGN